MEKMGNFKEMDDGCFAGKNKNWSKNKNFKQINVLGRNVKLLRSLF